MTDVLVVDDSQFIRTVVGDALEGAGCSVTTAASGERALELVDSNDPDVITMDVEMPGMSGIETVERIMSRTPTPILMLSAYTDEGAKATLDALERGALDVLQKPDGSGERNIGHLTDEVVEKVEQLSEATVSTLALARATAAVHATDRQRAASSASTPSTSAGAVTAGADTRAAGSTSRNRGSRSPPLEMDQPASIERAPTDHPLVIIGASTGGPRIIERIVATLPSALEARVLIVQHMPGDFTGRLATRLDTVSDYAVTEATDGAPLEPGQVIVAKGGFHMRVVDGERGLAVRLDDGPRVHGVRPAIDVTMQTAAEVADGPLCGLVLTGMGRDGARGIDAIKTVGGHTIAQDEATSPVFGIPQQAIATGSVDEVVPASALVERLVAACLSERTGESDE